MLKTLRRKIAIIEIVIYLAAPRAPKVPAMHLPLIHTLGKLIAKITGARNAIPKNV